MESTLLWSVFSTSNDMSVFRNSNEERRTLGRYHFGDALRPITIKNLHSIPLEFGAIEFLKGALGDEIEISIDTAERMRLYKTQAQLDKDLYKMGKIAWEDIGVLGLDKGKRVSGFQLSQNMSENTIEEDLRTLGLALTRCDDAINELSRNVCAQKKSPPPKRDTKRTIDTEDVRQVVEAEMPGAFPEKTEDSDNEEKEPTTFLSLPAELRNRVYELTLVERSQPPRLCPQPHIRVTESLTSAFNQAREPGLLFANKQIRKEALPMYYSIQEIVAIVPPPIEGFIERGNTLAHVTRILPFARKLTIQCQFDYEGYKRHSDSNKRKYHSGSVVYNVRLLENKYTMTVYIIHKATDRQNDVDCCDRSNMGQIQAGVQWLEKMFLKETGAAKREVLKDGETRFIFVGKSNSGEQVNEAWALARQGKWMGSS